MPRWLGPTLGAALVALAACKARSTESFSELRTDETKAVVTSLCHQLPPEGNAAELLAEACQCLHGRNSRLKTFPSWVESFCGSEGQAYFDRLKETARAESLLVLRDDSGTEGSPEDLKCAEDLAQFKHELLLDRVVTTCKNGTDLELVPLLALPKPADPGACWRFTRMDRDACIIATPCAGRGPARLGALPVLAVDLAAAGGDIALPEGSAVRLCNDRIQTIHSLKDPEQQNLDFNYPFANYLALGRSNKLITYGAANCHGTAQALAGNFLSTFPVEGLTYHGPAVEEKCGAAAQAAYDHQRALANDKKSPFPTGATLPIDRGGYVINMNHEPTCDAKDCGKTSFHTYDCSGSSLESYIFFDDMCVNCWDSLLSRAGFHKLSDSASWRQLKSNCILTSADHSITVTYVNDGFCYFYESLAPHAAPQMNVMECPQLYNRYPKRWCSDEGFPFRMTRL